MMQDLTVTVAVLTYNPNKEKLLATLRSVVLQKSVRLEIVVADDGSKTPGFDTARRFFEEEGFENYRFVENPVNRGTVYNTLSALENSSGKYVKLISPGDLLAGEDVLCRWVQEMEAQNARLSFAEAVYYAPTETGYLPVRVGAHPQQVACYLKKDTKRSRYQYLICDDLMLGAATLCHKDTLLNYVRQISGKVVYAEDNVYRLMAYDNIPVCYFPENAVLYETGIGVSTSGSDIWAKRLKADWDACSGLLLQRCTGSDPIDKPLKTLLSAPSGSLAGKLKLYCSIPGLLLWRLRKKLYLRKTDTALPEAFLSRVLTPQKEGE